MPESADACEQTDNHRLREQARDAALSTMTEWEKLGDFYSARQDALVEGADTASDVWEPEVDRLAAENQALRDALGQHGQVLVNGKVKGTGAFLDDDLPVCGS
jgi:hypothetical protein